MDSTIAQIGGEGRAGRVDITLLMDAWVPHIPGFSLENGQNHDHYAALNSVVLDGEELCRAYRVPYHAEEWAYTGLPFIIVADHSLEIASAVGIEVVVRPAYHPALTARLELALAACAKALASATPETAMQVFILEIIRWNQQALKRPALPSEALAQNIKPSPVAIVNWGMQRITGAPSINPETAARVHSQLSPKRPSSPQKGQ